MQRRVPLDGPPVETQSVVTFGNGFEGLQVATVPLEQVAALEQQGREV